MAEEKLSFQTEVGRILHIVANSLYSEKQVFLRELISNASDACDRLRYEAITQPELTAEDAEFRVRLAIDKEARTIEVSDNGIGMNRDALVDDLGTIARSGSTAFIDQLSGDSADDMALIGQFGVGFYSAFMVADHVEVVSRRAGEDQGWRWASDGQGEFTIGEAEKPERGTTITLHVRESENEFLEPSRLRNIVQTYSDHISLPIILADELGEEAVNKGTAIWARPRADITKEQYSEFYHHVGHAFDEPWLTLHWRAEGRLEYTGLVFVPTMRPFDLFDPQRRHRVKLYVKRVFITDECEELLPSWLRFLRGIIDCEDLPLNVSREMLQNNPIVASIKGALVNRLLGELEKKAGAEPGEDADSYATFWDSFGPVIKEGIYEDFEYRDRLLKLARFKSTAGDGLVGLADYVARMKDGQAAIYYITGEDEAALRKSPQLEGFAARGVEVLLLTDPVDEFWVSAGAKFEDAEFKSATRAGADLTDIKREDGAEDADKDGAEAEDAPGIESLLAMFRLELKDEVKDVRASERLTDSTVCLVADEGDMDIHLERLLKQNKQLAESVKRVLEVNISHQLIKSLAGRVGEDGAGTQLTDAAWLLLDQARILEGEPLPDPSAFSRRMAALMEKGLAG